MMQILDGDSKFQTNEQKSQQKIKLLEDRRKVIKHLKKRKKQTGRNLNKNYKNLKNLKRFNLKN